MQTEAPGAVVPFAPAVLRQDGAPRLIAGLNDPRPVRVADLAPTSERDALIVRLRALGFQLVPDDSPVQRWRLANARALGYPGGLNVYVPERFSRSAPLHLHLHGYILAGGGNLEQQVFRRTDKHNLWRMVQESGTQGVVVMPESPGNNTLFNAQWSGDDGARRFDAFTGKLARTIIEADSFASASLSTHSGSGLLGDRLVLNSTFGRQAVRYRGHFDDGYGTRDWRVRYQADKALVDRGGYVVSLARVPRPDGIGEGSNHMNAAAYFDRTGREPRFVSHWGMTVVADDQLLPAKDLPILLNTPLTERMTRYNLTTRNHWEPKNAFTLLWGLGREP